MSTRTVYRVTVADPSASNGVWRVLRSFHEKREAWLYLVAQTLEHVRADREPPEHWIFASYEREDVCSCSGDGS